MYVSTRSPLTVEALLVCHYHQKDCRCNPMKLTTLNQRNRGFGSNSESMEKSMLSHFHIGDYDVLPCLLHLTSLPSEPVENLLMKSSKVPFLLKLRSLRKRFLQRRELTGTWQMCSLRLTLLAVGVRLLMECASFVTKEEHIVGQLNGMSVQEALEAKKLFMLDYHDIYIPFVNDINALDGRKTCATRTIFYLNPQNTLMPVSIELSLPPPAPGSQAKRIFTPAKDAITYWLWQLAKAPICLNDAGVHQLKHHWLRTHACFEPYAISANRQMGAMHPVFKLLQPHMRYTMEINALAKQSLIGAGGVIESSFTPGKHCMRMSAAAYKDWRFEYQELRRH